MRISSSKEMGIVSFANKSMGCSAQLIQVGIEASIRDQPSLKTHHFIMVLRMAVVAARERACRRKKFSTKKALNMNN
ncbi:hypothetical protein [Noviherbaspirillum soli]|uniref:hypothetical protein n=1 Tax=Noviherbaspirillum soli TaxID=1064518 RepID=UPI00188A8977|nr:hypothetical protein [Noviherbaspirillum soli]